MSVFGLDDPPLARCNRCGRSTWSLEQVSTEDRMTQPDGNPCGGLFVPELSDSGRQS